VNLGLTAGGYVAALALLWLWIGAKEDLASQIERCNAEKLESVAQAENTVRKASRAAYEARLAEMATQARREEKARQILAERLRAAQDRPAEIREVIKEIPRETNSSTCLDLPVPDPIIRRMRD